MKYCAREMKVNWIKTSMNKLHCLILFVELSHSKHMYYYKPTVINHWQTERWKTDRQKETNKPADSATYRPRDRQIDWGTVEIGVTKMWISIKNRLPKFNLKHMRVQLDYWGTCKTRRQGSLQKKRIDWTCSVEERQRDCWRAFSGEKRRKKTERK